MTERKRLTVAAFTVGWLVIASGTAGAVVAIGHGASKTATAAAATAPTSAPSASPSSSASPTPSPSPTTTTTVPPTTPSPTSTVTGSVGPGLTHKGDLRFFLLPVPSDGSVIGDPDGKTVSKADVADGYSNSKEVTSILGQLGFKGGATREYQTGDAKYHVVATLMQFGSAANAKLWFQGDQAPSDWKTVKLSGVSGATAYSVIDKSTDLETLRGLYYRGDVVLEVLVIGESPVDPSVLAERMNKQLDRLSTGK